MAEESPAPLNTPRIVYVSDCGPKARLCWKLNPKNLIERCDRKANHPGDHAWVRNIINGD